MLETIQELRNIYKIYIWPHFSSFIISLIFIIIILSRTCINFNYGLWKFTITSFIIFYFLWRCQNTASRHSFKIFFIVSTLSLPSYWVSVTKCFESLTCFSPPHVRIAPAPLYSFKWGSYPTTLQTSLVLFRCTSNAVKQIE